jgi:hypothetical protein
MSAWIMMALLTTAAMVPWVASVARPNMLKVPGRRGTSVATRV